MLNTKDYRQAPGGDGPLAAQWADKPHRLVYDLCKEVERLQAEAGNPADVVVCRWCDRLTVVLNPPPNFFGLARQWSRDYAEMGAAARPFDKFLDAVGIRHHTPFEVVLTADDGGDAAKESA
jgi:hypothetical protein